MKLASIDAIRRASCKPPHAQPAVVILPGALAGLFFAPTQADATSAPHCQPLRRAAVTVSRYDADPTPSRREVDPEPTRSRARESAGSTLGGSTRRCPEFAFCGERFGES